MVFWATVCTLIGLAGLVFGYFSSKAGMVALALAFFLGGFVVVSLGVVLWIIIGPEHWLKLLEGILLPS
jgi:hypothetical protein